MATLNGNEELYVVVGSPTTVKTADLKAYINGSIQAAHQANSVATDVAGLVADFNALLAKLQAAGLMASS